MIRLPRMSGALGFAIAFAALIAWLAPHQLGVTAYKLSLVSLAAVCGYAIDREMFPYGRPHELGPGARDLAEIRRALIVAACIVGIALGA